MRSRLQRSRLFTLTSFAAVVAATVLAASRTANAQPAFQLLHSFGPNANGGPTMTFPLIQATNGDFYGTTYTMGGGGTVFKMEPDGTLTVLHAFVGATMDGFEPGGALIQASNGNFYGTTITGGAFDSGTVFEMTPAGTLSLLHSFAGGTTDGKWPEAALIQASDGNFYGTTTTGGTFNSGTVFEMTPAGTLRVLHSFGGGSSDGAYPTAALIRASDGNFYGTTSGGGSAGNGTVFKMTPTGTVTVLHAFTSGPGGPGSALIQATDGNFYGTALHEGAPRRAIAFKITPAGAFTVLHTFAGTNDDTLAYSSLIQASDGKLYGTAGGGMRTDGVVFDNGAVFEMTPAGAVTVVHVFTGGTLGGAHPDALIQASDGNFYGTTESGGAYSGGGVFRLAPGARAGGAADFDGNGQADPAVYRPSTGQWLIAHSSTNYTTSTVISWGGSTDVAVPGDYDGDGTADIAVYRPSTGTWYILSSSTGRGTSVAWGNGVDDQPVSGDFDGDGKTDIAVYRPSTSTWYIRYSSTGRVVSIPWGNSLDDQPVSGDFDGDGTTDIAVYRPSTGVWYILSSSTGMPVSVEWGNGRDDQPVSGDFDGDGTTDIAVYRPSTGTWNILCSSTNRTTTMVVSWGASTDIPVSGDFDGDGKTDPAVFRPSTGEWFVLKSSATSAGTSSNSAASSFVVSWGAHTDTPIGMRP